ncbi:MAG: hypothetical protein IJU14_00905 [Clostridia bacterium]|nr:hypothetical protein [Clostridia bacterium]
MIFRHFSLVAGYPTSKVICDNVSLHICTFHQNSETPKKKPKGRELSAEEKSENKRISHERIFIEHINAKIKPLKS